MAVARAILLGVACALALGVTTLASAQTIPAFPGADGAAANVAGGRGGIVYHVTKLNSAIDDPLKDTLGTIRYGLNNSNFPAGPRTIVFDVGGVFNLGRLPQVGWDPNGNGWDAQSRLTIGGTNVTLAGQTAPGAGVIFMGGGIKPQGNNNIIRNISVAAGYGLTGWWKPGDPMRAAPGTPEAGTDGSQWFPDNTVYDAMDISGTNLMIDHVSLLYATDETLSMNEVAKNISVQYSNISQGQNYPQWDAEGGGLTGHALGSLLEAGNATSAAISFHHNLYAHQKGRMPQMQAGSTGGGYYDFRNNVFYNWFGTAGSRSGTTFVNLVNNFYLAGDGGDNPAGGTNPAINNSSGGTGVLSAGTNVYRNGNVLDSNKDADANDGTAVSNGGPASPLWAGGVNTYAGVTDTAGQTFDRVLDYVGSNWWNRDAVIDTPDERIINEARTGTGKVIAWADDPWNNSASEGVEWRALKNTPQTSRAVDWDPEASIGYGIGDGMPSWWELAHGLDPNARDDAGDFDADGYTNLEEYMNEIAAWPAPAAIVFNGATNTRYAQITNWDVNADPARTHNWQPSKFDVAHLRTGTTVVDAVGQHAGMLAVAPTVGDNATFNVTAGWLDVAAALNVGAAGTGVVNHSAGLVATKSVTLGGVGAASGTYNLSGTGALRVVTLAKGTTGGVFNFTGGTLVANTVAFDLVNNGGTIAPGSSPGATHVQGDLTLNAGTIAIELAGTGGGEFDEIQVDDHLTAGGTLSVTLLGSFIPVAGNTFDILDFTSASGAFALDLPALASGLSWNTSSLLTTGALSVVAVLTPNADFNGDEIVDGQDLLVWQRGLGLTAQMDIVNGDADRNGTVDSGDLLVWKNQLGTNPAALAAAGNVPEPAGAALIAIALASLRALRCKRRNASQNFGLPCGRNTAGSPPINSCAEAQRRDF
jgi:hypothetical protein